MKQKLHKNITTDEFINNYWYTTELKQFIKDIGVKNYRKLRKDEIENIIVEYIKYKKIPENVNNLNYNRCNINDILGLNSYIENYKNNKTTKEVTNPRQSRGLEFMGRSKRLGFFYRLKAGCCCYWVLNNPS